MSVSYLISNQAKGFEQGRIVRDLNRTGRSDLGVTADLLNHETRNAAEVSQMVKQIVHQSSLREERFRPRSVGFHDHNAMGPISTLLDQRIP